VTEAAAAAGAGLAWLGATLLAISEGRRGLALGLSLAAVGLAIATGAAGQAPLGALALVAGGLAGAVMRMRGGPPGWGVLAPGSTPRLVGAVLVLLAVAFAGGSTLGSPAGAARIAALVVAVLAAGRILTTGRSWSALGAGSALTLGLGALGGPGGLLAGAAVAAGLGAIDGADPAGPEG